MGDYFFEHRKQEIYAIPELLIIILQILKLSKELERLIAINKIGMSVDHVPNAAKTIITIRIRMPENETFFTRTLFLTEKHLAIRPLSTCQTAILDLRGN